MCEGLAWFGLGLAGGRCRVKELAERVAKNLLCYGGNLRLR